MPDSKRDRQETDRGGFVFACGLELVERLAYFGARSVIPLYLVCPPEQGGLSLGFDQKGLIFSAWALIQCALPIVFGPIVDRIGYRKSIVAALVAALLGFLGMAWSAESARLLEPQLGSNAGFWVFLTFAVFVATGTAGFKPAIHGRIALIVTESSSSLAWGVFYWIVNVGSAAAPISAAILRGEQSWNAVFFAAAALTLLNLVLVLVCFRDPPRPETAAGASTAESLRSATVAAVTEIWSDRTLVLFLLCFSGFWLMFMQVWDLLPNFIDQWVDTSDVAPIVSAVNASWILGSGQVKPEVIVGINAWTILVLVLPLSRLLASSSRMRIIVIGMLLSVLGFAGCGIARTGAWCCAMLVVFSVGEILCAPAYTAYIGLIAPPNKKAQYMGYANVPFALGWAIGGATAGFLYEGVANKLTLARRYLVEVLYLDPAVVLDPNQLPDADVMPALCSALKLPAREATTVLWNTYHPWTVWVVLGSIGFAATLGMAWLARSEKVLSP